MRSSIISIIVACLLFAVISAQRSDRPSLASLTPIAKLAGSERQSNEGLGASAAVDGDTFVVGVPFDLYIPTNWVQGSAYVFVRNGNSWIEQAHLVSPVGAQNDFMGQQVAISGNTVVADCSYCDPNGLVNAGSPYVFVRNGTSWSVQQQIVAPDAVANEHYGYDVSIDGDTLAVSCGECVRNSKRGLVDIFTRSGTTWTRTQRIQSPTDDGNLAFGGAISLKGGLLVVQRAGAPQGNGSVLAFENIAGTFTYQQTLVSPEATASDRFGENCDVDGDTLAVYANSYAGGGAKGSVYIFRRQGSTWTSEASLRASDGQLNNQFGAGLDLAGDRILIGAYGQKIGTNSFQGQGYLFTRTGTTWTESQKMTVPNGAAGDNLGKAVALSGDDMYLGATGDNDGSQFFDGYGAVFVFKDTLSNVGVSGRVLSNTGGRGQFPALLTITDSSGLTRYANTNPFGYYRFVDLQPNRSYTLRVVGKRRINYAQQIVSPSADLSDVNFTPVSW